MAERASFSVDAMVRGYHQYEAIWAASISEVLTCQREIANTHDPFAVAVTKSDDRIVGHVPRRISCTCSLFIRRGGSITCRVVGSRRYSADLPQGGLEVPCTLTCVGSVKDVRKAERLVRSALTPAKQLLLNTTPNEKEPSAPLTKKRKLNDTDQEVASLVNSPEKEWVKLGRLVLSNT